MHFQEGPVTTVAGRHAREILWRNAGVGPDDIDVTGSYDAFTFTALLQFEAYGFCGRAQAAATSATAPSGSAAGARTTPAAATCARATRTASAW